MTEALTLARPYARAAFELAQGQGSLDAWSQALAFAAQVSGDPRVHHLLNDPRVEQAQLVKLHLPRDQETDTPLARFLAELAHHERLALLSEVSALFDMLKRESESTLQVKVTSALDLDAEQTGKLKESLKRRFKRDIELDLAVDADLMGGVVIDTGDEVIDGSARGRLARLAGALTH